MGVNFITVKMHCPRYCDMEKVCFRYIVQPNGEYIFSPFEGCENESPCESCKQCKNNENDFIKNVSALGDFLSHYQPL